MRFQVLSLIGHGPHPLTGRTPSPADRFGDVLAQAEAAERLGLGTFAAGSATSPRSPELAALHDPAGAYVGAGSGGLLIADTDAEAVARYKEVHEAQVRQSFKPALVGRAGYNTPYRTIEEAMADGPQLIGSPERIIDKLLGYHAVYGHDLQSVTVDGFGLERAEQLAQLERFAEEIAPVVRREAPTTLWG
ncbi:hypothetical protein ACWHAO_12640 [Streptomyces albidoflavus]